MQLYRRCSCVCGYQDSLIYQTACSRLYGYQRQSIYQVVYSVCIQLRISIRQSIRVCIQYNCVHNLQVDGELLKQLEEMGFNANRASRALYHTGSNSLEARPPPTHARRASPALPPTH